MYRVTAIIEFSYGHRLVNYSGPCAHLHGHNGRVEIVLGSESLDDKSMVADFSEIQATASEFVAQELDHRLLLYKDDPLVEVLRRHDEPLFLMETSPTAEAIARLIYERVASRGLLVCEVRLWETSSSVASYSPSRR